MTDFSHSFMHHRKPDRVRRLKNPLRLPRCEALLTPQTRQFWHGRPRPGNADGADYCGCFAKVKIGRRHYCLKHGALVVLKIVSDRGFL